MNLACRFLDTFHRGFFNCLKIECKFLTFSLMSYGVKYLGYLNDSRNILSQIHRTCSPSCGILCTNYCFTMYVEQRMIIFLRILRAALHYGGEVHRSVKSFSPRHG